MQAVLLWIDAIVHRLTIEKALLRGCFRLRLLVDYPYDNRI